MEFNTFETKFFFDLKSNNKACVNTLDYQSKLIEANLGEDGNQKTIDEFVQKFNDCLLLQCEAKKFKLFEKVLRHPTMKKVLEAFQKSDILIKACKISVDDKNKSMLKWLLTMNIDLCIQDDDGMTALMYAVKNSKLMFVVKYILENGRRSIHLLDKNGENALFHSLGQIEILNELLRTEIDVNHKNNNMENVLIYCCKNDIFEPIQYLTVRKDIDVNDIDGEERTAAMYLTEKARNSEIRTLNKRDCNYNYKNKKNESVMSILIHKLYEPKEQRQYGLISKYISILTIMVHFNCSFNVTIDEDENTAIMAFIIVNDIYTLYYVLNYSRNFDLSIKNKYGESASSLAMKSENSSFYLKLMLENPTFDYDYVDNQTGNTMLMITTLSQPTFIGKVLENNINSINSVNHKKENALIIAIKANKRKAIFELLNHHININYQDSFGNTALHYAVMSKNQFQISCLLTHNVDINVKNNEGKSPLNLANDMGDKAIIGLLTSNEALNNLENSNDDSMENEMDESMKEYLYPCITNTFNGFIIDKSLINVEKKYYGELLENLDPKYNMLMYNPITGVNYKKVSASIAPLALIL